ncbi:hypothetical protein OIDMADRAFT_17097 [Oidiodendron maius Zn]|uniref:F-box domain-containing protein n=1 Tax=Oidiodendron maius (strain Zn) TaxID=913774 RepID=A0A0C3HUR4_OIDMZ|nr:hypothetical protein OIDMADRAFT_17097 [Oidiodendron maius Zn]
MSIEPSVPRTIGTKGLFPLMELPAELRLEIYHHLLVVPVPINIETVDNKYFNSSWRSRRPSVAILQTCKDINEEGIPILYANNTFVICLAINYRLKIVPGPSSCLASSLFVRGLRWSTISLLSRIYFINDSSYKPDDASAQRLLPPRPAFTCTGADILARFQELDFKYSPLGPNEYMALSISNWVSINVMREMLTACHRALRQIREAGMELNGDDPVS